MTSTRKPYHIKTLVEIRAPFIVWGLPVPNLSYCSVMGDNYNGGLLATRHLAGSGRTRIAFRAATRQWKRMATTMRQR